MAERAAAAPVAGLDDAAGVGAEMRAILARIRLAVLPEAPVGCAAPLATVASRHTRLGRRGGNHVVVVVAVEGARQIVASTIVTRSGSCGVILVTAEIFGERIGIGRKFGHDARPLLEPFHLRRLLSIADRHSCRLGLGLPLDVHVA